MNNEHALLRLLNQYRVEQDEFLHDGRGAARPDIEAYARKMEALFAHSFHDAMPIEIEEIEDCGTLIDSAHFKAQILPHYYTSQPALTVITHPHCMEIARVDELIALLQKAREIMAKGSA